MDFTKLFLEGVANDQRYQEALSFAHTHSTGNIWLIGGTVFRNIARAAYGIGHTAADFDFVFEKPMHLDESTVPSGWMLKRNSFGNPCLSKDDISIDYIPLHTIALFKQRNLPSTIDSLINATPLTIQSIAFDIDEQRVIGHKGINAITSKIVAVNDLPELKNYCRLKGIDPAEFLKRKAESLYFYPDLSGLE
ncbi:MAG TPA: hypothetical protein VKE88_01735 [Candidatus Nanoarchaeia archaeon]|nr:hypothetical protein [Candidatus Nanoarchaeia archaeon]